MNLETPRITVKKLEALISWIRDLNEQISQKYADQEGLIAYRNSLIDLLEETKAQAKEYEDKYGLSYVKGEFNGSISFKKLNDLWLQIQNLELAIQGCEKSEKESVLEFSALETKLVGIEEEIVSLYLYFMQVDSGEVDKLTDEDMDILMICLKNHATQIKIQKRKVLDQAVSLNE